MKVFSSVLPLQSSATSIVTHIAPAYLKN